MNSVKNGYKLIAYYLSLFMIFIGVIILLPTLILFFYPDEVIYLHCFLIPAIGSVVIGYFLFLLFRKCEKINLEKHQDSVFVVCLWLLAIFISSFPFLLKGENSFSQCLFEATSGYATAGFSILKIENTPNIFLFYRSIMLFVGGVGLVLIVSCAISDKFGLRLFNAEGHTDRLLPTLAKTARVIFLFYFMFILIGTILLIICGIEPFHALNTSIASVSTGGFATTKESIETFNNIWAEVIVCILMILGSTSFMIHLSFFKGKFKNVIFDSEVRFLFFVLVFCIPLGALFLFKTSAKSSGICDPNYDFNNYWDCIRVSGFQIISAITTTGFANVNLGSYVSHTLPYNFYAFLIIFMLIGGCSGSTAGGIKIYRVVVSLKSMWYGLLDRMKNRKLVRTHFYLRNGNYVEIDRQESISVMSFILVYIVLFFFGSFTLTCMGYPLGDSMFEFSSALAGVGLGVGILGPTAPAGVLWIMMVGMFFGRLEIFVIFQALIREVNDIRGRSF